MSNITGKKKRLRHRKISGKHVALLLLTMVLLCGLLQAALASSSAANSVTISIQDALGGQLTVTAINSYTPPSPLPSPVPPTPTTAPVTDVTTVTTTTTGAALQGVLGVEDDYLTGMVTRNLGDTCE